MKQIKFNTNSNVPEYFYKAQIGDQLHFIDDPEDGEWEIITKTWSINKDQEIASIILSIDIVTK
ncbi:hypothetical protein [Enterobacter cancerogenus]|uniref:hypothetical protein n=1 Tax=Enterobacter cancerogenus TaxID=69218 RepID=UPI000FDB31AE|nr:hypothetical protein [Enterobacter cancerogenus]